MKSFAYKKNISKTKSDQKHSLLMPPKFGSTFIVVFFLVGLGCNTSSSFKSVDQQSEINRTDPNTKPEPLDADGILDSNEKEDSYSNPFLGMNGGFDPNSPDLRNDFTPTGSVKDQAIGTYKNGSLERPSNLYLMQTNLGKSAPFSILYPGRKTFFGTADMIGMVTYLGQSLRSILANSKLLIGDISRAGGGRLGRHSSHTNGLDVDIAYLRKVPVAKFASAINGEVSKQIFVKEQFQLLQIAVMTGKIDRIFIHPKIKNAMCELGKPYLQSSGSGPNAIRETLRRLIRDEGHANHFHLRLKCSPSQPRCIPMADPAKTIDCR